jgi:hypothetical protein
VPPEAEICWVVGQFGRSVLGCRDFLCAGVIVFVATVEHEAFGVEIQASAKSHNVAPIHDAGISEKPPQPQRGCAEFQVLHGNAGQWIDGENVGVICRNYDASRKRVPGVSGGICGWRHLAVWKSAQVVADRQEDGDAAPTINERKTQMPFLATSAIRLDDQATVVYPFEEDMRPLQIGKGAFSDRGGLIGSSDNVLRISQLAESDDDQASGRERKDGRSYEKIEGVIGKVAGKINQLLLANRRSVLCSILVLNFVLGLLGFSCFLSDRPLTRSSSFYSAPS